jgi:hypothetical protein
VLADVIKEFIKEQQIWLFLIKNQFKVITCGSNEFFVVFPDFLVCFNPANLKCNFSPWRFSGRLIFSGTSAY